MLRVFIIFIAFWALLSCNKASKKSVKTDKKSTTRMIAELGGGSSNAAVHSSPRPRARPPRVDYENFAISKPTRPFAQPATAGGRGASPSSSAVTTALRPHARPDSGAVAPPLSYRGPGLNGVGRHFNSSCTNFIKRDGSYGPWGQEMVKAMRDVEAAKGKSIFFGSGPSAIKFGQRCKNTRYFQSLSRGQQEHIWVWLWASIAQAESSCNPNVDARGIWNPRFGRYNKADGLFQLEYHTSTRNANGRDRRFCPDRTNTKAITFQMQCAASIMADNQAGEYVKDSGSYWQKLRLNGGQIFNLLRRHPLCR